MAHTVPSARSTVPLRSLLTPMHPSEPPPCPGSVLPEHPELILHAVVLSSSSVRWCVFSARLRVPPVHEIAPVTLYLASAQGTAVEQKSTIALSLSRKVLVRPHSSVVCCFLSHQTGTSCPLKKSLGLCQHRACISAASRAVYHLPLILRHVLVSFNVSEIRACFTIDV